VSQLVEQYTPEQLLLLQQQLQTKRKLLEKVKQYGLPFYRPHEKQDIFHRAGKFKRRMYRAGNRSGKSQAGVAEDCAHFMGERPWYPKDDPARYAGIKDGRTKGLVITTDWDKVDEVFTGQGRGGDVGKFWRMLPQGYVVKTKKNHSGVIDYIEGPDGSVIRFDTVKSFTMNPMGAESSDHDWVHWDEPAPEPMHKAVNRGLMDRGGTEWFTLTPLNEAWINDLFFPNLKLMKSLEVQEQFRGDRAMSWVVTGTTYDNPYLSPEDIQDFEDTLTEDEKECRIRGIPLAMSGMVYKSFDFDKHVLQAIPSGWEDYNSPPRSWPIYVSIDTHPQTPHAVLFVAVSPHGQKFLFEELFIHCSIETLSEYIHQKTTLRGYTIANPVKLEPAAWIPDPITMSCYADEFFKHGICVEKASKGLAHGILTVEQQFQRENNIYVAPNLRRWLYEITHYVYDKENKPRDKDDHLMECMYRMFINEPVYFNVFEKAPTSVGHEAIEGDMSDSMDDW
jgi:hypothetical protein